MFYVHLGLQKAFTFNLVWQAPIRAEQSDFCREFKKTPPHLTFLFETPLFTKVSESEVFGKHLTQHLTQQVTFLLGLSSTLVF